MSQNNDLSIMQETNNNEHHQRQCHEKRPSVASGQSSLSSSNGSGVGGEETSSKLLSSNADYDHIRNSTLMFFLDRLYIASKEGQEARTLHDLSCLFGTRDFTKEMRQIVGASRNGLKKFLQSYPSLFTIDGDKVYLSQLKQDIAGNPYQRDYNKEAVDYFTQKLLQFGTSLVPIRNLFGYRSQASQEVRHVSGKNAKEFKQFLSAHEDVFKMLPGEHVVLGSVLRELEETGKLDGLLNLAATTTTPGVTNVSEDQLTSLQDYSLDHHHNTNYQSNKQLHSLPVESSNNLTSLSNNEISSNPSSSVIDPYLNKQFAHTIEDCLKRMKLAKDGQISIEQLHEKILEECKNELFLKMVKTINDLKLFLRMYPKLFKRIRSDDGDDDDDYQKKEFVCLVSEEERRELELQAFPSNSNNLNNSTIINKNSQHSNSRKCDITVKPATTTTTTTKNNEQISDQQMASLPQNPNPNPYPNSSQIYSSTSKPSESHRIPHQHQKHNLQRCNDQDDTRSISSTGSSHQNSLNGSSSLRANAPPFVPTGRGHNNNHYQQLMRQRSQPLNSRQQVNIHQEPPRMMHTPLQRSLSNHQHHHQNYQNQRVLSNERQQNLSQRSYSALKSINNYHRNQVDPQTKQQNSLPNRREPNYHQPITMQTSGQTSRSGSEDLRARTVNIVREASNIISRIMTSTDAVAFDCKGYNLGFNGQITLIQFGWIPRQQSSAINSHPHRLLSTASNENNPPKDQNQFKPEVCIFDLITNPELAYCLKTLLESESIVKIVHDVRNKSNALHVQFDIMLNNVFDTQVANLVIQQQETGKPAYKSRYISMGKLCEIYGNESLTKYRILIQSKTRLFNNNNSQNLINNNNKMKDVNYWRTRPLTDAMVYESTMDVYSLVGGVYQNLKSKIKPEYMPLFVQLNLEGVLARIKPDEIRSVKKERKIDLEVIDLKLKLYSDVKSSIVLSNREIRLLRHIDLTEEVRAKIQQCKKVAKKLERLDMKAAAQLQSLNSQNSGANNEPGSMGDNLQSMDLQTSSIHTNTSSSSSSSSAKSTSSSSSSSSSIDSNRAQDNNTNDQLETKEEFGNLMNSAMFDELKDKMIDSSSSLLESIKDDIDDIAVNEAISAKLDQSSNGSGNPQQTKRGKLEHSGSQCSSCGCNCNQQQPRDTSIESSSITSINRADSNTLKRRSSSTNQVAQTTAPKDDAHKQATEVVMKTQETQAETMSGEDAVDKVANVDDDSANTIIITEPDERSSIESKSAVDMAVQCDLLG